MKLAVPTRGNVVDDHFGHCEAYTVFTVDPSNKIEKTEILPSPQGCGCKSNIASILHEKGVSVMLAGNMGNGALNVLRNHGIDVYRGCSGDVHQLAEAFLQGKIGDSGEGCKSHEHHHTGENINEHQCNHN
jgi:predicted Fe-Mo cluster-binding NifX family protein